MLGNATGCGHIIQDKTCVTLKSGQQAKKPQNPLVKNPKIVLISFMKLSEDFSMVNWLHDTNRARPLKGVTLYMNNQRELDGGGTRTK